MGRLFCKCFIRNIVTEVNLTTHLFPLPHPQSDLGTETEIIHLICPLNFFRGIYRQLQARSCVLTLANISVVGNRMWPWCCGVTRRSAGLPFLTTFRSVTKRTRGQFQKLVGLLNISDDIVNSYLIIAVDSISSRASKQSFCILQKECG